ncbi:hypothetical protein ACSSS7_007000 [Eimeria intestinalis]
MSELVWQGPLEGGSSVDTMASSLVGPLEASGSELAAAATDSLHQRRRGSFGMRHGSPTLSPQTSASDLLLHAQSCSFQGLLSSRTEAAAGAATPPPSNSAGSPSLTSVSSGEGEEKITTGEHQHQHISKQDFSFNALGEPLSSRSQSLSKKWNAHNSGSSSGSSSSHVGVEVETHTSSSSTTSSTGSSSNSNSISSSHSNTIGNMWSPFERDPAAAPVLLPFALAAATNGAATNAAAANAAAAAAAGGKADISPPSLTPHDSAAPQPRTLRAAVKGGLERLMRFSAWQHREALPEAAPAASAAATQVVVPSPSGLLSWPSDKPRGPPDEAGPLGVIPQVGPLASPYRPPLGPQDATIPFGVAHVSISSPILLPFVAIVAIAAIAIAVIAVIAVAVIAVAVIAVIAVAVAAIAVAVAAIAIAVIAIAVIAVAVASSL